MQRKKDLGEADHVGLERAGKDEYGASLIADGDDGAPCTIPIELARRLGGCHDPRTLRRPREER
eukprot:5158632-Pyramimonas_sp.AAC.1